MPYADQPGIQVICATTGTIEVYQRRFGASQAETLAPGEVLCTPADNARDIVQNVGQDTAVVLDAIVTPEQPDYRDTGARSGPQKLVDDPGWTGPIVRTCPATTAVLDALTAPSPGRDQFYHYSAGRFLAAHLSRLLSAGPGVRTRAVRKAPDALGGNSPESSNSPPTVASFSEDQQTLLIDSMHARLAERVRMEELAQLVGYSQYHFQRRFHVTFGTTPYQYLLALRIDTARTLLEGDDPPSLSWIASRCGFARTESFIRTFRAHIGTTPGRYAANRIHDADRATGAAGNE